MIIALLLFALMQDGPIQTAPAADATPQQGAAAAADPGPRCTFGGRPVHSPGCPTPEGRIAFVAEPAQPQSPGGGVTRLEDCRASATRRPSETEFACIFRVRHEAAARQAEAANEEDANPWEAVNLSPSGQASIGEGGNSRNAAAASPERGVPAWALTDPARWETSQCGAAGDDACRRQARNRLAMARAGVVAETPAPGGAAGDGQDCRMVMRRSESGFGGSLSRVCGDEGAVQALQGRLDLPAQPRPEPCDRPGSLETQAAWIARCQALPVR